MSSSNSKPVSYGAIRWGRVDAKYTGDLVGIEIETETLLAYDPTTVIVGSNTHNHFKYKEDGSLRNFGIEYISNPTDYKDIKAPLASLTNKIRSLPTVIDPCPRAGVHVHVNIRDLSVPEIWTMACAYWIVEDALVDWCGPSRVGNNFCLRLKDATRIVGACVNGIRQDATNGGVGSSFGSFAPNSFKYAALNLATVYQLGTLEFRSLDGTLDADRISTWIDQMVRFRHLAQEFKTPEKFFSWFDNELDKKKVFEKILTPFFYSKLDVNKMCATLYTSASFSMSIAFACLDWDMYNTLLSKRGSSKRLGNINNNNDDENDDLFIRQNFIVDDVVINNDPVAWEEELEEVNV